MIDIAEKIKNTDITNLMTKRVITIAENQPLQEASKLMYQNNVRSIIIPQSADKIDSEGVPIGIVTERDIARIGAQVQENKR